MLPPAFYGRCSTETNQDPASHEVAVVKGHGSDRAPRRLVVADFFDIGQSRSLPWKRLPEAARLLDALQRKDRGFDAVVIGEPHRAFHGAQFALTFPVLTPHGVALWVPEVGGPVDPARRRTTSSCRCSAGCPRASA